jgi:beta-lactamase superfamily II metal-dependent hydrolase
MKTPPGQNLKPKLQDIEVSLFGPGYGECVVIHLPNGKWIIVDSCIDKESRQSVALKYLQDLGVSKHDVILIVATHWHDDHIGGLASLVDYFNSAQVVISSALTAKEFLNLAKLQGEQSTLRLSSGMREYNRVIDLLSDRKVFPKHASQDKTLYKDDLAGVTISALSPSDPAIMAGQAEIIKLFQTVTSGNMIRVTPRSPNVFAVALLVTIKGESIILGADLTESDGPLRNWSTILSCVSVNGIKCKVFKVPHHGSENAHHEGIWHNLFHENPHALITEFRHGSVKLPKPQDTKRLKALTNNVHMTSSKSTKLVFKDPALVKTIREATKNARHITLSTGHIRATLSSNPGGQSWKFDYFGTARRI